MSPSAQRTFVGTRTVTASSGMATASIGEAVPSVAGGFRGEAR
jgi:hypothetical protein